MLFDPIARRRRLGGSALVLLALSLVLLLGRGALAEPADCTVTHLVGPATILRAGESLPLRQGIALQHDDQIVTGDGGRVGLTCSDGSRFALGERCSLSMAALGAAGTGGQGNALLDLIEGILRLTLSDAPAWEGLEVRTATAIAAVRSTDWIIEASADNTAVFVAEGRVLVSGRAGGQVLLEPGFGTDVNLGAPPTEPKRWGAARVESAMARTRLP